MSRVVYFELRTPDIQRITRFYEQALGWKFEKSDMGPEEYWTINTGDPKSMGISGGLMKSRDGRPSTINTVQVSNLDEAVEKITGAGGKLVVQKITIRGVGDIAYCSDPDGQIFGIWQPEPGAM